MLMVLFFLLLLVAMFGAVGETSAEKPWRLGLDVAAPRLTGSLVKYEPHAAACKWQGNVKAVACRVPICNSP
jgi:hypothetical protein